MISQKCKKMQIIDSHCHLYLMDFSADIENVVLRANNEGIKKFYLPAIDQSHIMDMIRLEERFPKQMIAMMGLHPCSVKENYKEELKTVENWLAKRSFAAIGEIGLDYYWDRTFDNEQLEAFYQQIEWALHYKLPIVIHSRNSLDECIEIVKEHHQSGLKGIFHCFSGNYEQAQAIIDLGFYMGIGGVVTYKNAGLAELLSQISMDYIVLETDAPYLTPVPFRGKRNESSYLRYIVQKIAEIKKISREEVARITTENAQKIFAI